MGDIVIVNEALLYLVQGYDPRVRDVDGSERLPESFEVDVHDVVHKEHEGLVLQLLGWAELLQFYKSALVYLRHVETCLLEPFVVQTLLSCYSRRRILIEHASDKILGAVADILPVFFVESKLLVANLLDYNLVVVSVVRRVTAEQNVQDDAKAPDVAGFVVPALQYLRGHIVGSAYNSLHLISRLLLVEALLFFFWLVNILAEAAGETKINQLYLRVLRMNCRLRSALWLTLVLL